MVTIIDGGGANPHDYTVTDGNFQTHIKIYNISGIDCVVLTEAMPVSTLIELGNYFASLRKEV